jgi:hypothetical protein
MRSLTLILFVLVTAGVTLIALVTPPQQQAATSAPTATADFSKVNTAVHSAAKLVVTRRDTVTTLDKTAEGWGLADKSDYPVPDGTIQPILSALTDLHSVAPKTSLPKLYSRLELDDPGPGSAAIKIEIFDAKGASLAVLIVGKQHDESNFGGHDASYVRVPGNPQTWLAEPALSMPAQPLDWIDRSIVKIDPARIARITITPASGKPLVMSRQKPDDKFAIEGQPPPTKKDDDPGADTAQTFQSIELDDVQPAAQLANAPIATVTQAETFDGLSVQLEQHQQDGQNWVLVHADGQGKTAGEAAEIAKRTSPWAYRFAGLKAAGGVGSSLTDLKPPAK